MGSPDHGFREIQSENLPLMAILLSNLYGHIPCSCGNIQDPASEPLELQDSDLPPVGIPSETEKVIEKVIGRRDRVKKLSNRIRMEKVGIHFAMNRID